jgi:glycosyltransferase involved in cell wall biosynthesis
MKTTCLVSNYNYARFIGDAVDGALRQSVPFDQIVVVDDGSKDGSVELLTSRYGRHPLVQIVSKCNEGQLSCFNAGFAKATGDVVFFLDADDVYEPDYVEQVLHVYRREADCDFLFCGRRLFGQRDETVLAFPEDRDLGYSLTQTAFARSWIGAATSCLSMKRSLLQKILPLPFVDEWRVRADDCLVFGSSLTGARKRYLARPLVRYRVHENNHHRDRKNDSFEIYRRRLAINRLFEYFERTQCFDMDRLADIGHREFLTLELPSLRQFMIYSRISLGARVSIGRKFGYVAEMAWHYLSSLRQRGSATPHGLRHGNSVDGARDVVQVPWRNRRAA